MLRLTGPTRAYEWGSTTAIPELLGHEPTGQPVAEVWLGTHALAPSEVVTDEGNVPLAEFAGELPFMLKVLAPDQPLSIQVHPANSIAELGFAAEEAAGVPMDDPTRDFKDPHHKPEMVYALSRFETLVGVRPLAEIRNLLEPLDAAISRRLLAHVGEGEIGVLRELLTRPPTAADVDQFVSACAKSIADDCGRGYETVLDVARFHPHDPGVVVALLLNRVTLEPGQAAFIGPGLVHAHLHGLCLEVMVSSDNVMRAGLTPKRINPQALLKIIEISQPDSPMVHPVSEGGTDTFVPPGNLFALSISHGPVDRLPGSGRRILLCLSGEVDVVTDGGSSLRLRRGEAAFVSAEDGGVGVVGQGEVAQAFVPQPNPAPSDQVGAAAAG
jgi:mannose-6-phosphate isomerase